MSDFIDRDVAKNYIDSQKGRPFIGCTIGEAMKIMLDEVTSAELERKTGEWVLYESRSDIYDLEGVCTWGKAYRCSECGFIHWVVEDFCIYSFCPNCGADMRLQNT